MEKEQPDGTSCRDAQCLRDFGIRMKDEPYAPPTDSAAVAIQNVEGWGYEIHFFASS